MSQRSRPRHKDYKFNAESDANLHYCTFSSLSVPYMTWSYHKFSSVLELCMCVSSLQGLILCYICSENNHYFNHHQPPHQYEEYTNTEFTGCQITLFAYPSPLVHPLCIFCSWLNPELFKYCTTKEHCEGSSNKPKCGIFHNLPKQN